MIEELKPCPEMIEDLVLRAREYEAAVRLGEPFAELAEKRLDAARAAITATDPDKRLREALELVTQLLEVTMPRNGYDLSYQCRNAVEAARAALSHNGG